MNGNKSLSGCLGTVLISGVDSQGPYVCVWKGVNDLFVASMKVRTSCTLTIPWEVSMTTNMPN